MKLNITLREISLVMLYLSTTWPVSRPLLQISCHVPVKFYAGCFKSLPSVPSQLAHTKQNWYNYTTCSILTTVRS